MEILTQEVVTQPAWYVYVGLLTIITCAVLMLFASINDATKLTIGFFTLAIIIGIVLLCVPGKVPTGQMSYTIEITDPAQYKILIKKGYIFERLFENKEIYTIVGDVLK